MEHLPAIVRILIIFSLMILAIKRRWTLGNVFICGALGLGLVFAMRPAAIAQSMFMALIHPKTLCLSMVVGLILVLSHSLEQTGHMGDLLASFKGLIQKPRINLVIFPALIGLLPMPGGAIFSAPMVKNIGRSHGLSGAHLSYINYWFRHIWEYWWPLYPGILLTTTLAGLDLWRLVFFTLPLTLVALIAGYWPLRGVSLKVEAQNEKDATKSVGPFFHHLAPIALVIFGGLGLGSGLSVGLSDGLKVIAKELGLIIALVMTILWVWRRSDLNWNSRWGIVRQRALLKMLYMVASILIFKGILEDSTAVAQLSQEMLKQQIPLMPICIVLPFLVGGVGGITIAFVGATFPILISLIQALDQSRLMLPYMMLALASGFIGVLLSPLHMCLLLSNEYFQTSLMPVYRYMRMPLAVLLVASVAYFGLLYRFMA